MIKDHSDIIKEYPEVFSSLAGLREKNGSMEFALQTVFDELHWFPVCMLSKKQEAFLQRLIKLGVFR